MKRTLAASMLLGLSVTACPVWAETVLIEDIIAPAFTEVKVVDSESWVLIPEIDGLQLPVNAAVSESDAGRLVFSVDDTDYSVSRSDVELSGEKIVSSPCRTVPGSMTQDTRSASVKGAGESC